MDDFDAPGLAKRVESLIMNTSAILSPTVQGLMRISLPLMLTALSGNFMFLLDRLILARYSVEAMNAVATASMGCAIFQFGGVAIASIAEVFVGQHNGAGHLKKTPEPVWQMIWFSLSLFLIFWPIATWGAPFLLPPSLYNEGKDFFWWVMMFGPLMSVIAAISSFFIGRGFVKLVTWVTLAGNLLNAILNLILVFGVEGYILPMGAKGSAIATISSQLFQVIVLAVVFLNKYHRETYDTHKWHIHGATLWSCLKIGTPSAVNHMVEIAAWASLFWMTANVGLDCITIQTIGNSTFVFFAFVTDGIYKGVIAIASNLIGAKKEQLISKLFYSGFKFHCVYMSLFAIPLILFPNFLIHQFLPGVDVQDPLFQESIRVLRFVWMFFVFDGMVWILAGILTAGGDTRFIMVINATGAWLLAIMPIYIAIHYFDVRSSSAWGLCTLYGIGNCIAFFIRYKSNRWKHEIMG